MATLTELWDLHKDGELTKKVASALIVEATELMNLPTPTTAQKAYAAKVLNDPLRESHVVLKYLLGVNANATVAQIQGATDDAIKTNVGNVVPKLVDVQAGI